MDVFSRWILITNQNPEILVFPDPPVGKMSCLWKRLLSATRHSIVLMNLFSFPEPSEHDRFVSVVIYHEFILNLMNKRLSQIAAIPSVLMATFHAR